MESASSREMLPPVEAVKAPKTADQGRLRVPIRLKIILPYLALALLIALVAAYLVTRIVFDTLEERFTNQLIEAGNLASAAIVRDEERLLKTVRLLKYAQGVPEALAQGDAQRLRDLAFGIVVGQGEEAVEFLDSEGNWLLSMHHRPGDPVEVYAFSQQGGDDFLQWPFVQRMYAGVSDELGDKYSGHISSSLGEYFYIGSPVFAASGEQVGVLLVGRSLPAWAESIRQETLAQVTLYGLDGGVLASTMDEPQSLAQDVLGFTLGKQDQSAMVRPLETSRNLSIYGLPYAEILGPWEVRGDIDLGVIGTAMMQPGWVNPNQLTRIQITLGVALSFLLVALLGASLANYITRPITKLVKASHQVAQGDLEVQVAIHTNDEVQVLAAAFNQMVRSLNASKRDLVQAYDNTLEGWSRVLELRDKETEGHTMRVARLTLQLAERLGIEGESLTQIYRGAVLHDIGKMAIPDLILMKEGALTEEEWVLMRKHPVFAYEMLSPIEYLRPALEIPYCHHERWDGGGYPRGLKGEEIPLAARIFAVVDVWDALISDRPYRRAMSKAQAMQLIHEGIGAHFDPVVAKEFIHLIPEGD